MNTELKPCPLCGNRDIRTRGIRDGAEVYCYDQLGVNSPGCGASVHAFSPNATVKAIEKWNTRPSTRVEELEDALRRLVDSIEECDPPAKLPIHTRLMLNNARQALTTGEDDGSKEI